MVPTNLPGITIGKKEDKMGQRTADTREVLSTVQWLGVGAVLAGVGMLSVASARARRRERRA